MARPSRYQPDFARQARGLCRLGADNAGLARYFSVSPATLYRWLNDHPAFAASVAAGRAEAADPQAPTRYERATGYACRTARVFAPRGAGEPVIAYYTRRIPADPKVALRWLRNRRPERWSLGAASMAASPRVTTPRKVHDKRNDSHNLDTIVAILIRMMISLLQACQAKRPGLFANALHPCRESQEEVAEFSLHVSSQNTLVTGQPRHSPSLLPSPSGQHLPVPAVSTPAALRLSPLDRARRLFGHRRAARERGYATDGKGKGTDSHPTLPQPHTPC